MNEIIKGIINLFFPLIPKMLIAILIFGVVAILLTIILKKIRIIK